MSGIYGGLYDADEGYLDPYGTTVAYVAAARKRGAELILRNRVLELHPRPDGWDVVTEQGTIRAEHVVNAGGLWAKQVGRMAGGGQQLAPMHHPQQGTQPKKQSLAMEREVHQNHHLER